MALVTSYVVLRSKCQRSRSQGQLIAVRLCVPVPSLHVTQERDNVQS